MKKLIMLLCLAGTSLVFAQSNFSENRGEKRIESCYYSDEDVSICTAKIINRKLNRILSRLEDRQPNQRDVLKVCNVSYCTFNGKPTHKTHQCGQYSNIVAKKRLVEARNEAHAIEVFAKLDISMHEDSRDRNLEDSVLSVTCNSQ